MKKTTPSLYLLLKQGFKGVFKFRIQFIIILILSFLATLVLTVSLGAVHRLRTDYHQVVGNVEPFNETATTQIGKTAVDNSAVSMNELMPVPLLDFVNNANVSVNSSAESDKNIVQSDLNFVFKTMNADQATFLTRFSDRDDAQGFYQITQNYFVQKNLNAYQFEVRNALAQQFIEDLRNFCNGDNLATVAYLKTTSWGFLKENNPEALAFLSDFIGFDPVKDFDRLSVTNQRLADYLYWTMGQMALWLGQQLIAFAELWNRASSQENAELFYEFIIGKPFAKNQPLQTNFIGQYQLTATSGTMVDNPEDDFLLVNQTVDNPALVQALKKKGYRGFTSPLNITTDSENKINNVIFTKRYGELTLLNPAETVAFTKTLDFSNDNFYFLENLQNPEIRKPGANTTIAATMWQYHLALIAKASGYRATFRKEQIIFDNISSRKFRFVVLNGFEETNFTVLRGSRPAAVGEVAISPQFAKANNLEVGDYLKVGQSPVIISGFATDTYSFFPAVDPNLPIPQVKTEAFLYGDGQTLKNILNGYGNTSSSQDMSPRYFTFFLTIQGSPKFSSANQKDLFINLQMDLPTTLVNNYQQLRALSEGRDRVNLASGKAFFSLTPFENSNFRLNWTIMPEVTRVLALITYLSAAIIAVIALVALVICVKKTIAFNAKQIGILKALGTSAKMLATTYLAYGIIIMLIVIPIAWLAGVFLQIPFSYLFATYFGVATNIIYFSWPAFLITFFGFGLIAIGTAFLTAFLIAQKSVLEIIQTSMTWTSSKFVDFLKRKSFKDANFYYRFSLTLASSGKKPIILLTTVIALTSLLISGALALPSIANNAVRSYYKNVHYANSYDNLLPTANSPLSKPGINYWQGNEKWDNNWVNANLALDNTNNGYGYYLDPTGYMDLVSQSSPIPRYIYLDPEFNQDTDQTLAYVYFLALKKPELLVALTAAAFGDNYFTVLGQSFNIGTVDQFLGLILNADFETIKMLLGTKYDSSLSLDANKQVLAKNFSNQLTLVLPEIINAIFASINGGINSDQTVGDSWKQKIINIILTQVPPYIKNFIYKSPSRLEQFGISFNAETYTPEKETLVTTFPMTTAAAQNLQITGIDEGQNAYALKNIEKNDLYFNQEKLKTIQTILQSRDQKEFPTDDLWLNNVKVWNPQTKTLTIPIIANRQAEAAYKLKHNKTLVDLNTKTRQLTFVTKNGDQPWQILPRGAWAYDNRDFLNSLLYQDPKAGLKTTNQNIPNVEHYQEIAQKTQGRFDDSPIDQDQVWLDIYKLENNKFTYQEIYYQDPATKKNLLNDGVYFFNDFALDSTQELVGAYNRPYYSYRNIKLFIPSDLINEDDLLRSSDHASSQGPGPDSYFDYVQGSEVPDQVARAWNRQPQDQTKYLMIRPYDLNYTPLANRGPGGLDRLTNGNNYPYWLRYAFDRQKGPGALNYDQNASILQNPNVKVDLEVVGTLASFESKLLLMDSNIANLLLGYSTARSYGRQISYFQGSGKVDLEHNQGWRPWSDQLLTYQKRSPWDEFVIPQASLPQITYLKNQNAAKLYAPHQWHTSKLSNIPEPEGLTSSVSFNVTENLGQYSLGLLYPQGLGMTTLIENQILLSSQKALINQIYALTLALGLILIIAIIITASLLIMLVGDIYIAQYQQFMILMRALGYSNWQIQTYAFGAVVIFSFCAWLIATFVAWIISYGIINNLANQGFAIPYGFSWWPPLLSLLIIGASFVGSLMVSSRKARTAPVSSLMNSSQE